MAESANTKEFSFLFLAKYKSYSERHTAWSKNRNRRHKNRSTKQSVTLTEHHHICVIGQWACITSFWLKLSLHYFYQKQIWVSTPTKCQWQTSLLPPRWKWQKPFFPKLWLLKLFCCCGCFRSAHIVPTFTQQGYNTEELSQQSMAEADGIVSPSTGITEQISRVRIVTVLEDDSAFAAMNRSMVFFYLFFCMSGGSVTASPRCACWRRRRESN